MDYEPNRHAIEQEAERQVSDRLEHYGSGLQFVLKIDAQNLGRALSEAGRLLEVALEES